MHKDFSFSYDATVGINLGTKMVKVLIKGCDINSSTCSPCGHIKTSSWHKMDRVQNPRGLMRLEDRVYPLDGNLFSVSCSLIFSLGLWLFDFVILLPVNRDRGDKNHGPRYLLNLSNIY